ncbi:MAG: hypothetical protein ACLGIK_16370, partial [Gemmatimonadota bacterium]
MKIAVCIKRVPEMDVNFKIAPSGKAVDETGLKWDMSDFDGYAVEEQRVGVDDERPSVGEAHVDAVAPRGQLGLELLDHPGQARAVGDDRRDAPHLEGGRGDGEDGAVAFGGGIPLDERDAAEEGRQLDEAVAQHGRHR